LAALRRELVNLFPCQFRKLIEWRVYDRFPLILLPFVGLPPRPCFCSVGFRNAPSHARTEATPVNYCLWTKLGGDLLVDARLVHENNLFMSGYLCAREQSCACCVFPRRTEEISVYELSFDALRNCFEGPRHVALQLLALFTQAEGFA
jgi:hypothetical protein